LLPESYGNRRAVVPQNGFAETLIAFCRAAFAPSLPRGLLILFGKCATVRFRFAAAAAFFAPRRFLLAI
jgi:hypothetical protein